MALALALAAALGTACGNDPGPAPAAFQQLSPEPPPPVEADWPADELRAGGEIEAAIDPGETHVYRLPLEAGDLLRVEVEQIGVDVELRLEEPDGEVLLSADRPIGRFGPELVLAVAGRPGLHRLTVRAFPSTDAGRYRARIGTLRSASDRDRLAATTYRRYRESQAFARRSRERAAAVWAEALTTWRELGEEALEAEVLARQALDHYDSEEWGPSAKRYREALAIVSRLHEPGWELVLRHDLAAVLIYRVEYDEAVQEYGRAAELAREVGDLRSRASILYGLGVRYQAQGEIQSALARYESALEVLDDDDPHTRPLVLHNLGTLYWHHFQDPERARSLLLAARDLYRPEEIPTHAAWKARTLKQLGLLAYEGGKGEEARRFLEEALAVRTGFDRCGRATALASLAWLEDRDGAPQAADARMAEAFETLADESCSRSRATVHLVAGEIAASRGAPERALAAFERSRELSERAGDRSRLVDGLAGVARCERALGRLPRALDASRQALAILEDSRPTLLREDLRTRFFATAQDHFDLHVALLLEQGAEEEAWQAAERARAQALRDLLAEAGAGLRRRADPALVAREGALRRRLNVLEGKRLKAAEAGAPNARALQGDVDTALAELERVRGEIRRRSPAYAALTAGEPLSVARVQHDLLDPDTLLLEYRLGAEASWLWAIGRDSFAVFPLPAREEVERNARQAVRWMRSLQWPGRNPVPLCELTRQVLAPAARLLGHRRLALVTDGALEAVPFAALPDPGAAVDGACTDAPLLGASHEVVQVPSAAALLAQRRLAAGREPAPGWLAVVADPVYGSGDERLRRVAGAVPASLVTSPASPFERLRHAGEEAAAVLAGLPPGRTFAATGLDASKATVASGALARHRIVHFATHGVLNAEHPLLSYLALSDRSPGGDAVDGALYAHEIYDLELSAELVVLSACDTALGRQVRGEGLVSGLPRAFLYAGAERVLVSLWPVQDRSTRDLMARFYRGLVAHGLPPGRALQEAQGSLRRAGRPPYQWAGFVLQGDWRPLPPFDP